MVTADDGDDVFKFKVVEEILMKRPEKAIKMLSQRYRVEEPSLKVGVVKGRSTNVLGVYVSGKNMIYVRSMEVLYNPFVIIHEFYHHLRTHGVRHRGTEKQADRFAKDFIDTYLSLSGRLS